MQTKNAAGLAPRIDPDDAPELTEAMLADAEVFEGDTFVRRGRGRPPTGKAKELISVRLDQDVLAELRSAGPGWQSQVNTTLRADLVIAHNAIEQDIDAAKALRDRWIRRLAMLRQTGGGRLRIGGEWETNEQAETRLQAIVDHHTRTVELLEGFRFSFPDTDE